MISAGMRWKIGPRNFVNIIGQPCLLDDRNPFITSNPQRENHKVSALMTTDHRGWDEDILRDMFSIRDQQCIKRVPLSAENNEDVVYWGKEASGQYTVKSAYRLLQEQKKLWMREDQTSTWRKAWRIKARSKVLNFMWRAFSNCLPTIVMLRQKNVPVETIFQLCKVGEESVKHLLCQCPMASYCWHQVIPQVTYHADTTFYQWWERVLEVCDGEK